MFREVKNAAFARRLGVLGWAYCVEEGGRPGSVTWRSRRFRALRERQLEEPVELFRRDARVFWLFEDRFYWEDEELSARDVLALVRERERRQRRKLERAHAVLAAAGDGEPRRRPLPIDVRKVVWERDGGRCVDCGSDFDLQYDHVIPLAMGGANTVANVQLLCAPCNQRKGATLG